MNQIQIRSIEKKDDAAMAAIIRSCLEEFGAAKPGTVYFDPTTDALTQLFTENKSVYNVAVYNGDIVGGAGVYPTPDLPEGTCELVKMYLKPEVRGKGLGRKLIELCLQQAGALGYKQVYLESMPELKQALSAYARLGFEYLNGPMGNSGHTGCSLWMLKKI